MGQIYVELQGILAWILRLVTHKYFLMCHKGLLEIARDLWLFPDELPTQTIVGRG